MVQTVVITICAMGFLMAIMAVGVIFSNRELQGSCGGPGSADCACDLAGKPRACEALDGLLEKKAEERLSGEADE